MVLEATMIIVDNSESSRNGDYVPSRWEAQADAVNLIFSAKTQANPESSVGLMNMAGKGPETLVTLTTDFGKVLDGMHRTKIRGHTHLATAIQIAGLALKHRQNKSQRQRIIVFTCSPIDADAKDLVRLAKKMKKNNIAIDFIAFGDLDSDTTSKLEAFNENIRGASSTSGEGGSHLEIIHPGPSLLSDHLLATPILAGESGGAGGRGGAGGEGGEPGADVGGAGAGGAGLEFGVDPSTDPELALALRMSLEEEKARQEKERKAAGGEAEKLEGIPEGEEKAGPSTSTTGEKAAEEEREPLLKTEGDGSGPDALLKGEDEGDGDGGKKDGESGGDKMDTS